MGNSFRSLKAIGSITVASFSLLAMPFITISEAADEDKSRSDSQLSAGQIHIVNTEVEMTDEDAAYIYNMRDHYHLD